MVRKRNKSTREDFLKACENNGIVFKESEGESIKRDYIEVFDDDGNLVRLANDFNLINNPYKQNKKGGDIVNKNGLAKIIAEIISDDYDTIIKLCEADDFQGLVDEIYYNLDNMD